MSNDMVQVNKPGSNYHRLRGAVVAREAGNRYVVEFYIGGRYLLERFDGSNLRALITVRA
jgi:hypothetical protein